MKTIIQLIICLVLACAAKAQSQMLFRLQASGNAMQNETVVYFDSSATVAYNSLFDAPSLGVDPGHLNIVTCFDSTDYQVKALPVLNQGVIIPVKVTTGVSGQYIIKAQDLQNLPSGACILLQDTYSGTSHDLRSGDYSCTISDTESVARFTVNIIISSLPTPSSLLQDPSCASSLNGKIIAQPTGSGPWNYYWKDSANNIIRTILNRSGSDTLPGLRSGHYRVDINVAGTCSNVTKTFSLKGSLSPVAAFTVSSVASVFSSVHFTNTSVNAVTYSWDFGDGMGSSYANASHSYSATNIYTVTLSAFSSVCNETSTCTKTLTVVGTTGIQEANAEELAVISRDAEGYYVLLNQNGNVIVSIHEISGKSIAILKPELIGNSKIYLGLDQYRNNVVLVNVLQGDKMTSRKIIVE